MKVRVFEFANTEEGRDRFFFLYQGFVLGGNSPQAKGMEAIRREAKILDKMEAISEVSKEGVPALKPGAQKLTLDQPEYEMLRRYFENAPWNVIAAQKVVNTSDWIASIPQTDDNVPTYNPERPKD